MALGTIGLASPAMAGYTDCPRGHGCQWNDPNWPGNPVGAFQNQAEAFSYFSDNAVDSIVNNGYCGSYSKARWYEHSGYTGDSRTLYCPESGLQSRDPYLTNGTSENTANFSNKASSFRFVN